MKFVVKGTVYKRLKEGIHQVTIEAIGYKYIDEIIETDSNGNPIVEIVFKNKDGYKIKKNIILNKYAKETFRRIALACKVLFQDEFDITSLEKSKLQIIVKKIYFVSDGQKVLDESGNFDCYYKVENLYFKIDDNVPNDIILEEQEEIGKKINERN